MFLAVMDNTTTTMIIWTDYVQIIPCSVYEKGEPYVRIEIIQVYFFWHDHYFNVYRLCHSSGKGDPP